MTEIRPIRAPDAPRLTGLLAQLGCLSELNAATSRLAHILSSATQQVLVAVQHGLHTVVVRSTVARPESHPFYGGIGYQRTKPSHIYCKGVEDLASVMPVNIGSAKGQPARRTTCSQSTTYALR